MNQEQSPVPKNNVTDRKGGEVKTLTLTHSESFSGPIPPPAILEEYERIHTGLADRIMKMAESQSEHRKTLERKVILHDRIKSILGLIFAFLIVVIAIGAGVYLAVIGQPIAGGIVGLIPLGTIVGAFIYQQREEKKS